MSNIYVLTEVTFRHIADYNAFAASTDLSRLVEHAEAHYGKVYLESSDDYKAEREDLHRLKRTYYLIEEFLDMCELT